MDRLEKGAVILPGLASQLCSVRINEWEPSLLAVLFKRKIEQRFSYIRETDSQISEKE